MICERLGTTESIWAEIQMFGTTDEFLEGIYALVQWLSLQKPTSQRGHSLWMPCRLWKEDPKGAESVLSQWSVTQNVQICTLMVHLSWKKKSTKFWGPLPAWHLAPLQRQFSPRFNSGRSFLWKPACQLLETLSLVSFLPSSFLSTHRANMHHEWTWL